MAKCKFVIVGSGWRAQYYIRIAKALPDEFELCGVLCRSKEKADSISNEYEIKATTSETELENTKPDFVVVAVTKSAGAEVAMKWMDKGFTVLLETPAGLDIETLNSLWHRHTLGQKVVVAEQYTRYPQYSALTDLIKDGVIGECSIVNLSLAHDYHGASLIRALLDIPVDMGFSVSSKTYEFPTTETLTRYEEIHDGRIAEKKRRIATFEFDNGKVAVYDFDSEQYRSPIRKNTYKLQGVRGEVIDNMVYALGSDNKPFKAELMIQSAQVERDHQNPNIRNIEEIEKVSYKGKDLYVAPFGLCGLSDDETAIAILLKQTGEYAKGTGGAPYALKEALQDAYMAIKMQESECSGVPVKSGRELWMR